MRFPAALLALSLVACGKDGPDEFDKYRAEQAKKKKELAGPEHTEEEAEAARTWIMDNTPAVRERLAKFAEIAKTLESRPPVFEPEFVIEPGAALDLDPKSPTFNTGILRFESLATPCGENQRGKEPEPEKKADDAPTIGLFGVQVQSSGWLDCGACLAEEKNPQYKPGNPIVHKQCYERLQAPKFVAVVRLHEQVDGKIVSQGTEHEKGSFLAGALFGDVLLIRLEDGAYLSGFPVVSENSDTVSANRDVDARDLESDLESNFGRALDKALEQHLLGVVPDQPAKAPAP